MPTATDLANFVRCSHRVFLDANGDTTAALRPSAEMQRLWEEGRAHEVAVIEQLQPTQVSGSTTADREAATLALMAAGAPLIYHAVLRKDDLVGEPDLLKRIETPSALGGFAYAPADVKLGRATKTAASDTTKTEYAVQLCAYAELLEAAQGVRPENAWIVDRTAAWHDVDLRDFTELYADIRARFDAVQTGGEATIPGWKTSACTQCAWRDRCWKVLQETDDLTTMASIGIPKREKLWKIGIRTVADLATADPETLAATKGLGKVARSWPLRARAVKSTTPILLTPWIPPAVDIEISYDIENLTDPFVYLHGLLIRPTGGRQVGDADFVAADYGSFEPVCAVAGESEESVWMRFLQKIESLVAHGSIAVYIYSPAERVMLRRLKTAYGGSEALAVFEAAIIDMCKIVKRSVIFPTDGDGLKAIAHHIGFEWRDPDPGGGQSITWWKRYLEDPIANAWLAERVVTYNEDDVRATFAIRDWLVRFGRSG